MSLPLVKLQTSTFWNTDGLKVINHVLSPTQESHVDLFDTLWECCERERANKRLLVCNVITQAVSTWTIQNISCSHESFSLPIERTQWHQSISTIVEPCLIDFCIKLWNNTRIKKINQSSRPYRQTVKGKVINSGPIKRSSPRHTRAPWRDDSVAMATKTIWRTLSQLGAANTKASGETTLCKLQFVKLFLGNYDGNSNWLDFCWVYLFSRTIEWFGVVSRWYFIYVCKLLWDNRRLL